MISYDAGSLSLCESAELPERTLVAPLQVVREIRSMLGCIDVNVRIGSGDAVFVSSDLFAAFNEWDHDHTCDEFELN